MDLSGWINSDNQVILHDHAEGDNCNSGCYEVPKKVAYRGDTDDFKNCDNCGAWPTHAPFCTVREVTR